MSDHQNDQKPPEDTFGPQDGASNQASANGAHTPPEGGAGYPPPPQDYQPPRQDYYPPQQGYYSYPPPPSWNDPEYPRTERSTAGKVFKVMGIIFIIIAAVIAFAVVGCFALVFFPW